MTTATTRRPSSGTALDSASETASKCLWIVIARPPPGAGGRGWKKLPSGATSVNGRVVPSFCGTCEKSSALTLKNE
jgi:hypothetical protein